jgi:hypothetical protein
MRNIQLFTTTTIITLFLAACEGMESEGDLDESRSFDLRGGATITLTDGTEFDADELESRKGYGATLTDSTGAQWFTNVEQIAVSALEEGGLTNFPTNDDDVGYLGVVGDEYGEECQIYLPFAEDSYVRLTRVHDGVDCPESLEDVSDWLPTVQGNGDEDLLRAFGNVVGTLNGITAYSNGTTGTVSNQYSTVGMKWQCVEYANRYFYQRFAHKNLKGTGNAKDYFGTAAAKDLVPYSNGVSTTAPAVGDMLASNGNGAVGNYGHLAIIREVGANYVKVIHQNWSNSAADNSLQLSMSLVNGKYTISNFGASLPVTGWLRRTPVCMPTVNSVSPSTATLNQSKQFTASGSCLSTTTTAPFIPDCANLVVNNRTATQVVFTCTPSFSTGIKAGVIKHNTDGTVLKNFSVTVNN